MTEIRTLLVANRGEIARRVMRTAREMGISTAVVFSDADEGAQFVREADVAVRLPGVAPADTYLRGDLVVAAALAVGADAIHPGYGFLSENAEFATRVAEAGLVFVGPTPETIAAMGSKIRAKQIMAASGVPVLPGVTVEGDLDDGVGAELGRIGYPLLVKASAGGGGRGMRIVESPAELEDAVSSARREAASAFGDDTVFVEKYVRAPRHIEVQIFGDSQGTIVHLFERECSIQRRYQKIVEESPSPVVTPELRARLGEAAIAAGRALGYVGAGTVEFVLDASGEFHFLEVNTRLQVEHPVTELVTGLDLVRLQLLVAQGHPLPPEVLGATISGHAIEVRLYAEDPSNGFLPTSGTLRAFELPDTVRVDGGFAAGDSVSIHYDPMLAKVIAHAPTRTEAARVLASALRRARVHGVVTNRQLLAGILTEPEFLAGGTDTAYLDRHPVSELTESRHDDLPWAAAAAVLARSARNRGEATVQPSITAGWRNVRSQPALARLATTAQTLDVRYVDGRAGLELVVDGQSLGDRVTAVAAANGHGDYLVTLEVDGVRRRFGVVIDGTTIDVDGAQGSHEFTDVDLLPVPGDSADVGSLAAPMPGTVIRVGVAAGDEVEAGQVIVILEAMKMEHSVRAPLAGTVESVSVRAGDQVDVGQVLAAIV